MGGARFNIPSTSALIAFEATARLGGVIRASEELNTSQSAVSRHIRNLETAVGEKLFRRQGRGVVLTPEGQDYYTAVKSSLESLHAAGNGLRVQTPSVVIACTQEISYLLLMPVFPEIKRFLGREVNLRILTCDYDMVHLLLPAGVDIIFEASAIPSDPNAIKVLDEEFAPVASPDFVRRFQRVFARHPRRWSDIPRLESSLHDGGWGTWTTWFRAHDCDAPKAPVQTFENYQYLLEAAANGEGLALGWNGLVNAYLESNRLVRLTESWLRSNLSLYAVATETGSTNRYAVRFLKTLAGLGERLTGARQVSPQRQPTNPQAASFSHL